MNKSFPGVEPPYMDLTGKIYGVNKKQGMIVADYFCIYLESYSKDMNFYMQNMCISFKK